jgi:ERCC4-type nuclease
MLLVDSREKPKAIKTILKEFEGKGVPYSVTKLFIGDYQDYGNPFLIIDRKQSIQELAANCTRDHDRFKRELERAKAVGARLIILVEQNRYKDRDKWIHVETIEDIMLWSSPHTTIRGEKVFRVLRAWMAKYDIDVQFCDKRQTGKRILEILYKNEKML